MSIKLRQPIPGLEFDLGIFKYDQKFAGNIKQKNWLNEKFNNHIYTKYYPG